MDGVTLTFITGLHMGSTMIVVAEAGPCVNQRVGNYDEVKLLNK